MNTRRAPKLPPNKIHFEGLETTGFGTIFARSQRNLRWARVVGFRAPKKGEYYLGGAIIEAYRAPNDLLSAYWIVEPVAEKPAPILHEYAY